MYLNEKHLALIGFKRIGQGCKISDMCRIYNPGGITIGDNVTIKDFCILSAGHGGIDIGDNVMIEPQSSLRGKKNIKICDDVIISSMVTILSSSNDYKGQNHKKIISQEIEIGEGSIIGHGTLVLPGTKIETGCAIGANSMIKSECKQGSIFAGTPGKKIGEISSL